MLGFDIRVAKIVWTVFLVAFLLFITYMISSTLLVVVFSIFFSYLVYPLIQMVERYRPARVPRTVSIALVFVLVVMIVTVAGSIFGAQIQEQAIRLSQQIPALLDAKNVSDRIPLPDFMEPLRQRVLDFISSQVQNNADQAVPLARNFGVSVMHAASNLIYLVLVPVLSFLLIKEAPAIREELLSWLNQTNKRMWSGIIQDMDVLLSKYVRALLLLAIATLLSYGIAFSVLGVPYPLLLAGIAAVLEFIPFAGPLAAVVITLAVAAFSGYPHLLWLLGFIFAYRLFQDYVLSPILMSEGVEVSPLLVIIGLLAGDQLGGVAGIFLSVPVIAALKIVFVRASASRREKLLAQHHEIVQE
ncbi:AI-2E family transporter [Undibacterium sp.]|jgi:predicted PurR-regulated permease PerM|uniref:AI-2E family transporter n=1 Tax=Undibacterium sp. TaxID=1914977 RepID=UPI002B5142CE|nr:AI-2E family transporter [Undibacterium sp.]HTD05760.1 AI-2E family transporter [Undibacterium sp.]